MSNTPTTTGQVIVVRIAVTATGVENSPTFTRTIVGRGDWVEDVVRAWQAVNPELSFSGILGYAVLDADQDFTEVDL